MSWKCEVHADNEWVSNGLRFATEKEAGEYGVDLLSRWILPNGWRAVKTNEPVTHCWDSKRGLGEILPEVQEGDEYYCVVCGKWFGYDPDHEPHSVEGEDCHEECCPICNSKEEFHGGTLLHTERKE